MEYDPKDGDVVHLLKKLKDSNGGYPPEMLALRRQGYLKQVAEISGGAGLALGLKHMAKGGKGAGIPPTTGTIVEMLLVAAIIAEAGAVAYFYRDRIADLFQSDTRSPRVVEVSNPAVVPSLFVDVEATSTAIVTLTGTGTSTEYVAGTPSPGLAVGPTDQNQDSTNQTNQTVSTPKPPTSNGNNGNHYGQTPKPERTKKPGSDNSNNNQDNNTDPKKK